MAYKISGSKEESYKQLENLVTAFASQHDEYKNSKYSEAQLRIDFLNPLLKSFGWDVDNESLRSQFSRDVIQEESIDVEEEERLAKKNPDYTLRIFGNRKLFVEAKKSSIDISTSKAAAFQTRRYGWSANLGISVLTNFEYIIFYDCRFKPSVDDEAHVCRAQVFHFSEYLEKFEAIYNLFSLESIQAGIISDSFPLDAKGASTFDNYFLEQIESWREELAINAAQYNEHISQDDVNFLVQRLLNRVIFLRICEDREIEKYETLKSISSYEELKKLFSVSDKKYNSGLFDFIEDRISLNIHLDDDLLIKIFSELYYPVSPYDFSVIDPTILSQIYEKYLGSKIELQPDRSISIVGEPEVVASNGVVPTPHKIVKQIISETLEPLLVRTNFEDSENLKIADICCGSGTFLLSAFDYLIDKRTEHLITEEIQDERVLYKTDVNTWSLSLKEKQSILCGNIFGVDVNPYAVEVTRFGLLLKLIENENSNSIDSHLTNHGGKILPNLHENIKCGNSLLDNQFFDYDEDAIEDDELLFKLRPFEWEQEFPFLDDNGGFDAIIGNPPYVRIQNLVKYSSHEINYYKSNKSPYTVSKKDGFDKYYLFLERAIELLNPSGIMGYIVPHKFFIIKGGKKLRQSIATNTFISKIIHFGVTQVFPDRLTYTAILILDKNEREDLSFKRISDLNTEDVFESSQSLKYKCSDFSSDPWVFVSKEAETLFTKVRSAGTVPLKEVADIPVGLQTSADKIYIINPTGEGDGTYIFNKDDKTWEIEKEITAPCIYDVSINLFEKPLPNSMMIFPYEISEAGAIVLSEEVMERDYPKCWGYLKHYYKELDKRSINGANPVWYQFGRSQSLAKFHDTPKLIFSVLSKEQSYGYDDNNILFTGGGNGPYYSIIPTTEYSIFYLLGILSHPIIESMVKSGASEFQGEYYSHGKQFIENIPIKTIDFSNADEKAAHNSIVRLVETLVNTSVALRESTNPVNTPVLIRKTEVLQIKLIGLINNLYEFTADDLKITTGSNLFITEVI